MVFYWKDTTGNITTAGPSKRSERGEPELWAAEKRLA
jgi:hypothetical protein